MNALCNTTNRPLSVRQWLCSIVALAIVSALSGCAAISSTKSTGNESGLFYYLPKRDVLVTVTVAMNIASVNVQQSDAFPDLSQAYIVKIPRDLVGDNDSTIGVNTVGLLQSDSSAKTTSELSNIASNIASAAGGLVPFSVEATTACPNGTYNALFEIVRDSKTGKLSLSAIGSADPKNFCGFSFEINPVTPQTTPAIDYPTGVAATDPDVKSGFGLFYRQQIPYVVTAKTVPTVANDHASRDFVVLSPTLSQTYFLPLHEAAFGSNTGAFSFDSGVPTKYGQHVESELVGLTALPATVLAAYFKALGAAFQNQQAPITNGTSYLNDLNAADVARQKRQACVSALASNDLATIKAACS